MGVLAPLILQQKIGHLTQRDYSNISLPVRSTDDDSKQRAILLSNCGPCSAIQAAINFTMQYLHSDDYELVSIYSGLYLLISLIRSSVCKSTLSLNGLMMIPLPIGAYPS